MECCIRSSAGMAGLIISEFLPVSLLTPLAKDLSVTEGVAGQAISVTAMVTSLMIATITKQLNRRWILLAFCLMQIFVLLKIVRPSYLNSNKLIMIKALLNVLEKRYLAQII